MSTAVARANSSSNSSLAESALLHGDIEQMGPHQRTDYYLRVCDSLGLNPLTRPFEFLRLNGKMQLYARKDCTEQLRTLRGVSIKIVSREIIEGVYIVTAQAQDRTGRVDEATGAVPVDKLVGEARANAYMKAETKAKRRVTLSICGLGMLDESEVPSVKGAEVVPVELPKPMAVVEAPKKQLEANTDGEPMANDEQCLQISNLAVGKGKVGLGWAKPHAGRWLKKRFGVELPGDLTEQQAADAIELLTVRLEEGDEAYYVAIEGMQAEGRVLPGGE